MIHYTALMSIYYRYNTEKLCLILTTTKKFLTRENFVTFYRVNSSSKQNHWQ